MGWPFLALFLGYPVWWLLGVGEFACIAFTIPMAVYLLQRHKLVRAPRGIGPWLLFVLWYLGGIVLLQIHAPGAVSGGSGTRYLTFGYRLLWYLAATVVLLYVVNTRRQLSDSRLARYISYMFVVVTVGGVLGMVLPHLALHSALELALPHGLAHNTFVYNLIHPVTAQVQTFLGYSEGRPSAPFAYTNTWGLNFGCTLPFFLITWFGRDAGRRRYFAPFILFIGMVAMIYSLNRGLWISLIVAGILVALRYAAIGQLKILGILLVGFALTAVLVFFSPLHQLIAERLAHPHSNQGRTNLGTLTAQSTLDGSPLVGFGSTRPVQGNFSSIAGGASARCPGCSPPAMGTQGQLWLVLFSQGFVGLGLYLWFLLAQLFRHFRYSSKYVMAASTVLVVHLVTLPVYNLGGPAILIVMAAIGLLWRAREGDPAPESSVPGAVVASSRPRQRTMSDIFAAIRRHARVVVVLTLVGGALGGAYAVHHRTPATATQAVLVSADTTNVTAVVPPMTIDTDAQLLYTRPVLAAVARALGGQSSTQNVASRLTVTAAPNTRVLQISFSAASSSTAQAGARAAAVALLQHRRAQLKGAQTSSIASLQQRSTHLASEISDLRSYLHQGGSVQIAPLKREMASLQGRLQNVTEEALTAHYQQTDPGSLVRTTTVQRPRDGMITSVTSGLMLGLLVGLMSAWLLDSRLTRVRRKSLSLLTGAPVLATISGRRSSGQVCWDVAAAREAIARYPGVIEVLAAGDSEDTRQVAALLSTDLAGTSSTGTGVVVAIVASARTRARDLLRFVRSLEQASEHPIGIVYVEKASQ
ncbi:MAG: hypothetical protein ACRDPG_05870 [Nocardioidaceae bacterium]